MAEALEPLLRPDQDQRIAALLERVCAADQRLATAESCSGGMIASLLTDIPGCSHAFEAGFVTYSDAAKTALLDVSPDLLQSVGAVSGEVALAMVDGALARARADLAVAVTGFAGAGDDGQEAGLVFIGGGTSAGARFCAEYHFGDIGRAGVRLQIIDAALDMLDRLLTSGDGA